MKFYKISYAVSEIATIKVSDNIHLFEGDTYHYAFNGMLVYAIVKAETEQQAQLLGERVAREFRQKASK